MQGNFLFGLSEGHWPDEKTVNTVISILNEIIKHTKKNGAGPSRLVLHADNCAGQNKNNSLLCYLCWRVMVVFKDQIYIHFLITGHTKIVCDWPFGHVKRSLLTARVRCSREIANVIEQIPTTTIFVSSRFVSWKYLKTLTEQYFKLLRDARYPSIMSLDSIRLPRDPLQNKICLPLQIQRLLV